MSDLFWVNPEKIKFKISPITDLKGVVGGEWDLVRRHSFDRAVKFRSITQRFVEGRRWEETHLFADLYRRRFEDDDDIRGAKSIEELARQYYDRIDPLFEDMKQNGFRILDVDKKENGFPEFLLGRDGDVFIGNQGNHRLAIAKVIGLKEIAGTIRCRHPNCRAFPL